MTTATRSTLSSARLIWLRVVSWIYKLAGGLFVLMLLATLWGGASGFPKPEGGPSYPVTIVLLCVMAIALLLTGVLLARRARAGAVLALILSLYPWVPVLLGSRQFVWPDVITTVIIIAVIASIWPELSPRTETFERADKL